MAEIKPTFQKLSLVTITAQSGTEYWVDLTSGTPDTNSPIPNGKQIYVGYLTTIAYDKNCTVELRPNLPGKSLGTVAETQLRGFQNVLAGESSDMDMYLWGALLTLAPVGVASTGVEKLWARVKCNSANAADFDFLFYYDLY